MFPIKYIDNNLVWNKDNEVFAYYELIPYNYSFLSAEQKFIVHDSFRQLIAQSREGKIHALQIATESSVRSIQEQSKRLVTGRLRDVAIQKIDEQTEALVSMIGDNQVDYRFFIGFKLIVTEEKVSLESMKKSAFMTFKEFLNEVNHTLMNDFISMPDDEINRYMKMEKLLENKISRRFKFRRLDKNDFGYLIEHIYGRDGVAYEDYEYSLPKKKLKKATLIKQYDLIRPTRCLIEESQRYLRLEHEDSESFVSYFTVNAIVGELDFPSSEIFYFQQQQFTFPVDTSMNVEIVGNRKALSTVRNKKKELKDLDNHAYLSGSETSSNVVDALDSVDELETDLDQSKERMYKLSYVINIRISSILFCKQISIYLSHKIILIYFIMLAYVLRPSKIPSSKTIKSFSSNIISADSFATSTAVSTEIPISAAFIAPASLMPSPIKPTQCPCSRNTETTRIF